MRYCDNTYLDMLLQILRTFEGLPTELTFVRLKRHMNADVGCNVIAFDSGRLTVIPLASKVEVVCALATNMLLANMLL